ncbi:MAG: sensor domain-containing diguanylate cyclase [Betaproteobacteria bacterium]|nr:sensor domain-containing diguanylate cyclase [Betaproteobacteria bacterium]
MSWQNHNLSKVIEQISAGVAVTLTDGTIEYINPCLRRLLGLSATQLPDGGLGPFRPPADAAVGERIRQRLLAGESWQGETRWRTAQGELRDVLESIHPLHDAAGTLTHFIHFLQDISALKRAETLSNLAFYDSLTGLLNRNLFNDRLARACALAQRNGGGFAVLLIDIDHFKRVNDTLGHDAGDELLRQVGVRLRRSLRKIDTVARLGGDEFAAILENVVDARVAAKMVEKLLAACSGLYELAGSSPRVSLSVGISLYPQDADIPESRGLLKRADRAMYRAKAAGRNGYFVRKPRT